MYCLLKAIHLLWNTSWKKQLKHCSFPFFSRGHADAEIEAVFAKYDIDGDRVLNEVEQTKMQADLEGQKVCCLSL